MTTKLKDASDLTSDAVIAKVLVIAKDFRTAKRLVEDNKHVILKLREMFGVSQGSAGKKLDIEGNQIYWETFVTSYFGCTTRWMNELLGVKKEVPETATKPDSEKPLWKKGFQAGRESTPGHEDIQKAIEEGINGKYEVKIVELEKKLESSSVTYKSMLVKLLDEIETVGEKVPASLTQLAKNMRLELPKPDAKTTVQVEFVQAAVA
jgi:hypothetical protein